MTLKKRTGHLAIVAWGAAVLNLMLNIAFVPKYGMMASAWATFASFAFLTIVYFVISQHLWPIDVDARKIVLAIVITCVFTAAVPLLPGLRPLAEVPLKIAYVLACAGLFVGTGVVERRELKILAGPLRRIGSRA